MEKSPLPHLDERLGHVAIDMGLMSSDQVLETKRRVIRENAGEGARNGFGRAAMSLGFIGPADLEAMIVEERRRRRLISGYEIIDIIGAGKVSTVYHARQLAMDREVALKILHPRLASDPDFVRSYLEEAQAISRFHHPHIVQGFDAGESNGFYYFSHEYLSGGSIADRILAGDAVFSETGLLTYLRQTTSALKHAWAVAVYHGDINPGNLLLDGNGDIKLANLGVPRVAGLDDAGGRRAPGFVRSGPEYAAPEQLEKPDIVNALTDMYNLGATFYHVSFGVPPFPGADLEEILEQRRANPMPSFSLDSQERFSGKYLRLIHDMLEIEPGRRPADPEELADRLEKFHAADSEDLGGLARQVRQVVGPAVGNSSPQRISVRSTSPSSSGGERRFSLRMRRENVRSGRGQAWLWVAAVAALLVAAFFLAR